MWHDHVPYNHPDYDPVWSACQAAGFPVHTHSGEAPQDEYNGNIGIYLAEVVWWAARPAWHLLFSGAFERFPGLKFVVTEAAAYWAADMMWKWDQYMGGGHTTKKMAALLKGKISKLPSDYFGENIFIGASTMSKEEIRRRHVLGCDVVMWGTDYPHPEGTWPHTQERLRADFGGIPVEDARKLLGETAARCYGFDLEALRPIAEHIGPTPADLGQDPVAADRSRRDRDGALVEGRVPGAGAGLKRDRRERRPHGVLRQRGLAAPGPRDDPPRGAARCELGDDAIEIGPGPGFTTDILRTMTARLTAVEIDEGLAATLAERMAGGNVDVVIGDASALVSRRPVLRRRSFHMLHHIAPDEVQDRVFAELARVLVPGAVLVAADGTYNEATAAFHEDDTYNPIDPCELGSGSVERVRRRGCAHLRPRLGVHGRARSNRLTARSVHDASGVTTARRAVTVLFALAAAFCNALNLVTQHIASISDPGHSKGWRFVRYLLSNPLWLFGWVALAGAFVFQAFALHIGQMSVVQPLLVTELVFALVLRRFWVRQQIRARHLGRRGVACGALALFIAVSEPTGGSAVPTSSAWAGASP